MNSLNSINDTSNPLTFAIDVAGLGVWDMDPVSGTFTVNERLQRWIGSPVQQNISLQNMIACADDKDAERVAGAISNALLFENGGSYEIEYTIVHPETKQQVTVRAKGRASFDQQNRLSRFTGVVADISAEISAREQSQKLLALVDNSVDLMSILELNGTNSYINSAGREILGIEQDADVTLIPISHFHTEEQIAFVESEIIPNVMNNGRWSGQFAIRNGKTGEIIPLFNNCHRIQDSHTGMPIGVGAVMRDMRPELNARKELEEKVKERTKALSEANEELEKKNNELASFAYVSSHDLQEPLRKISTFISKIEKEGLVTDPERTAEYFRRIKISANRMQVLINDLLSFSSTNTIEKKTERVELSVIVNEVMTDLQELIQKNKAVIKVGALINVNVIVFQFHQLFINLVSNAIKFRKKDQPPLIHISGEYVTRIPFKKPVDQLSKRYYCITIEDNGIGFEPQYATRIFEVFQRLHGREEYEGTGIGLAICKKIVENHHGAIIAEGLPDVGAKFKIYLPEGGEN